jgi:hypothetical protein
MDVARVSADEVCNRALRSLSLAESGVDLFSTEAHAASLRRAASFHCPSTPGAIVRSVLEVLEGLPGCDEDTKADLELVLEALVGYGDLLELPSGAVDSGGLRLFLGAPGFVRRSSGSRLLMGIRPDGAPLVGDELEALVSNEGHARVLGPTDGTDEQLVSSGLAERTVAQWLQTPRLTTAEELIDEYEERLQATGPSGDIDGATLLDPSARITYYRGRWRPPKPSDAGTFVARRPQAYGADLWCVAHVTGGVITQLVDLPVLSLLAPAADEAWRLQGAIDAAAGHPQIVRVRVEAQNEICVLDFFAPLPSWAQRQLDVTGMPIMRGRGALFSYRVPSRELSEELQFLGEMLWMSAGT